MPCHSFRARESSSAKGNLEALPDAEIVDRKDIRPAEAEDQEHLHGPSANPTNLGELVDDVLGFHSPDPCRPRKSPCDGVRCQVLDRESFCSREPSAADPIDRGGQNVRRSWPSLGGVERPETAKNCRRGLSGELLVNDCLEQGMKGSAPRSGLEATGTDSVDETSEGRIGGTERGAGALEVVRIEHHAGHLKCRWSWSGRIMNLPLGARKR